MIITLTIDSPEYVKRLVRKINMHLRMNEKVYFQVGKALFKVAGPVSYGSGSNSVMAQLVSTNGVVNYGLQSCHPGNLVLDKYKPIEVSRTMII